MAAPKILSDYDEKVVRRMCYAVLQSPQGRDLGRYFLIEKGKKEEGNLGNMIREVSEVFRECVFDLYGAAPPIQTGHLSAK